MKCDIYRPKERTDLYLFVQAGSDPNIVLTDALAQFGQLELMKTRDILPGQSLVGASSDEILNNIERFGFHVQGVKVTTEVSEGGAAIGGGILEQALVVLLAQCWVPSLGTLSPSRQRRRPMTFEINTMIKLGPVFSGVLVAIIYLLARWLKQKPHSLEDIFVVGITGSSFPSGLIFIYAALIDGSIISQLSEAPVYIALAGFAILYIAWKTVKDKLAA
jgi:uncharacterized protein YcgL (UPF0745 family)